MHLFTSKFIDLPEQVTEMPGSITTPAGYSAAGIAAGIKASGKEDLGMLVSSSPCVSSTLFTTNAAAAAPVCVCRDERQPGGMRGVVVNSGSANAATGERGMEDARRMAALAASAAGTDEGEMAVASTGVIGVPLPMDLIEAGIARSAEGLSENGGGDFARAIQTTDRIEKQGAVAVELSGGTVHIGACAKGAGMIAPAMATMLCFITTDAVMGADQLEVMLKDAAGVSFNAISVDGDMSTNDSVFLFANGASGVAVDEGSADRQLFSRALAAVCRGLAMKMVADGEGATKTIELKVTGAQTAEEAAKVAAAVATSSLVRTAFYGRDANWGRLIASAGAALAGGPALKASVAFEDVLLAKDGQASGDVPDGDRLQRIMESPEIAVELALHRGSEECTIYFSDLTHDYVTLNAEYTT
jgi:glutamate N-acetyltransferase/amino-acid N-acetyltransferase